MAHEIGKSRKIRFSYSQTVMSAVPSSLVPHHLRYEKFDNCRASENLLLRPFVWNMLIAVTRVGPVSGPFCGGFLADLRNSPSVTSLEVAIFPLRPLLVDKS